MKPRTCAVEGCGSKYHSLGYCKKHYLRNRQYGSPTAGRCFDGEQMTFLRSLIGTDSTECVEWPYGKQKNGYGTIKDGFTSRGPHRVMCRLAHGMPPSSNHQAAHSCHNRLCVNPNHIRWATLQENVMDRVQANRCAKGERQHLARLSEPQVLEIRKSAAPTVELARRYSVSKSAVERVRNHKTWKHV